MQQYRDDRTNWIHKYDRVAGLRERVFKMDISGKDRLLFHWTDGRFTLLDMGERRLVRRVSEAEVRNGLRSAKPVPPQFWPESPSDFFVDLPNRSLSALPEEVSGNWLHWLDEQQERVANAIFQSSEDVLLTEGHYRVFLVIGGPGTGKTSVLLNLLKRYHDEQRFTVRLSLSAELAKFIRETARVDIKQFLVRDAEWERGADPFGSEPADILLIDDPPHTARIKKAIASAKRGHLKVVIAAFDPLQLRKELSDAEFAALLKETGAGQYHLNWCYRQRAGVGRATKRALDVIAASAPYIHEESTAAFHEDHAELTALANTLEFRREGGHVCRYPNAELANLQRELSWILQHPSPFWRNWPSVLVVAEDGLNLPPSWRQELRRVEHQLARLSDVECIKGLEFQHALLFLSNARYEAVRCPRNGYGPTAYRTLRLLRIPFSRARDGMITFVLA